MYRHRPSPAGSSIMRLMRDTAFASGDVPSGGSEPLSWPCFQERRPRKWPSASPSAATEAALVRAAGIEPALCCQKRVLRRRRWAMPSISGCLPMRYYALKTLGFSGRRARVGPPAIRQGPIARRTYVAPGIGPSEGGPMPKIKLTKTVVDGARPEAKDYEIRDTVTPRIPAEGHAVRTSDLHAGLHRRERPAAKACDRPLRRTDRGAGPRHCTDWLADVRRGTDPSADRAAARAAPTVKELCQSFISDYSLPRNKPSTSAATASTSTPTSSRSWDISRCRTRHAATSHD